MCGLQKYKSSEFLLITSFKLFGDKKIRNERDYVYVRKGGLSLYGQEYTAALSRGEAFSISCLGHVVIDEMSAYEVVCERDLRVATIIKEVDVS